MNRLCFNWIGQSLKVSRPALALKDEVQAAEQGVSHSEFARVAFRRQGITLSFYEADTEEDMDVSILDTCLGWWND